MDSSNKVTFKDLTIRPLEKDGSTGQTKAGLAMEIKLERLSTSYMRILNGISLSCCIRSLTCLTSSSSENWLSIRKPLQIPLPLLLFRVGSHSRSSHRSHHFTYSKFHSTNLYILLIFPGHGECLQQTVMNKLTKGFQFGDHAFTLKLEPSPIIIMFPSATGMQSASCLYLFQNIFSSNLSLCFHTLR